MDFFRKAGEVWRKADQALGGWLPGGGVASPVTKAVKPAQPAPGRTKELEEITGVKSRIVDPTTTPTLVRSSAPMISSQWGTANYANPLLNEIGMSEYRGGATPLERHTEFHELGHLNPKDKGLYSYIGTTGRFLQGVSEKTGNLPPMQMLAGLGLKYADAPEEDRAERFAKQYASKGKYPAPAITPSGESAYGQSLRKEGQELIESGIEGIVNPFGLRTKITEFINRQQSRPLQEEYNKLVPQLSKALLKETGDSLSPKTIELSRKQSELENRLRALGIEDPFSASGFKPQQ
jgi:hypothetical protein